MLDLDGIVQVVTNAVELIAEGRERILLVAFDDVADGESEGVQVILDAEELQRIFTVAFDCVRLQAAKSFDLTERVQGEDPHREECRCEAGKQSGGG